MDSFKCQLIDKTKIIRFNLDRFSKEDYIIALEQACKNKDIDGFILNTLEDLKSKLMK